MAYGIDTTPFYRLMKIDDELPTELHSHHKAFEGILFAYVDAFECLLSLVSAIMRTCGESQEKFRFVSVFLPVYAQIQERILELLRAEICEWIKVQSINIVELGHDISDSQVTIELIALDIYLSQSEGSADPVAHLGKAITVTNSIKKQIENHTRWQWIKSVLHTLTVLISTITEAKTNLH